MSANSQELRAGASDFPAASDDGIINVITHVTELVRSENNEISELRGVNHHEYNLRKSEALLALNRYSPLFARMEISPAFGAALQEMRGELEINRRLLDLQLRAARAVAELITRAIYEGQSDGTYTSLIWKDELA